MKSRIAAPAPRSFLPSRLPAPRRSFDRESDGKTVGQMLGELRVLGGPPISLQGRQSISLDLYLSAFIFQERAASPGRTERSFTLT